MEENLIFLENKITEYDLLYKKWCKKIDMIIKNISINLYNQDKLIISKDTKNYFSIMYQNQRQTFLRFWQTRGKITLLSNGDALEEKTIEIGSPSDLYHHMEDINKYVLTFKK